MPNLTVSALHKKTLPEITALNVLLCMFVIFIHVSSAPVTSFLGGNTIWGVVFVPWRLLSINVRGFIFLSGMKLFLNRKGHFDYFSFYKARLLKIVLPYVLWNIVYYCYFLANNYTMPFSPGELLGYISTGTLVGPFYFIIVIIQFYALAPLWMYLIKKIHPLLMLIPISVLTLFFSQYLPDVLTLIWPGSTFQYTDRVFTTYLLFWMAGCYAGYYYEAFKKLLRDNRTFIFVLFLILMVLEGVFSFLSFSGIRAISWLELIHYLYSISAIVFLYMFLSDRFESGIIKSRLIPAIDKASYQIFLIHSLVIFIFDKIMVDLGITRMSVTYLLRILLVYSVSVGVCILWNTVKQAIKRILQR